jgi:conjugal transfer pilus assembly protein TraV
MRANVPRGVGLVLAGAVVLLSACTSLSGVGGDTQYACPAPRGVQCGSVSANYLQSLRGDLPGQPPPRRAGSDSGGASAATVTPGRSGNANVDPATPLYSPPRILKLWVAPWEDRDGVLHDAAFVFVPIDHGHWLLDPVRAAPRLENRAIRPTRPAVAPAPANPGTVDADAAMPRPAAPADPKDGDAH